MRSRIPSRSQKHSTQTSRAMRMGGGRKLVGAHPPKPGTEYIKAAHKYLAKVKVGEEVLHVGIVTHERSNGHEHYDHFIVSKKR